MIVTNRRKFISLGIGTIAASALSAFAEKKRQIWYAKEPPASEALLMPIMKAFHPTRVEINVGATTPFSILHISDSHLAYMNSHDLAKADATELQWYERRRQHFSTAETGLAAALLYAKAKGLPILHTGDLVDYMSDANVRSVQRNFEGRDILYAIGNHELSGTPNPGPRRHELAKARAELEPYFPNAFSVCARQKNGINLVAFDNVGMNADQVEQQFAAIKAEFAKGLPVVLACHIPFYADVLADTLMDSKGYKPASRDAINESWLVACPGKPALEINRRLRDWLPRQKNLKAILCGHMHTECQAPFTDTVTQYICGASFKGNAYEILFT